MIKSSKKWTKCGYNNWLNMLWPKHTIIDVKIRDVIISLLIQDVIFELWEICIIESKYERWEIITVSKINSQKVVSRDDKNVEINYNKVVTLDSS